MARFYYSLLIRENGRWGIQFGDYDRTVVEAEETDGFSDYKRVDRKIIKTASARQAEINAAVATLNK